MKTLKLVVAVIILWVGVSTVRGAQEKAITAIEVQGNKRVSTITIVGNIKLKVGDIFSPRLLQDEVRRLYDLGYFSDIEVATEDYQGGVKVIFKVQEKLVIKELNIQENKVISKERIKEVIKLKEGAVYNKKVLAEDIKEIENLYRQKGFHMVKITTKEEIKEKEGEVILDLYIREGKKLKIKEIRFTGNSAFTDKQIRKGAKMKTTEDRLFASGIFSQDVFDTDLQKIILFYKDHGYVKAEIVKSDISTDVTKNWMSVIISISEGDQFRIDQITLRGNEVFKERDLSPKLTLTRGEIFSQKKLEDNKQALQSFYAEKGYIFASIRYEMETLEKEKLINLTFVIREDELAYIDELLIRGNTKTKDKVIRRELVIKPGERFDGEKIKKSRQNLNNLGYFDAINFDIEPGTAPNRKNLIFEVEEKKTGTFTFGGGYSSVNRVVGFAEVSQNNFDIGNFPTFMGGGQTLKLRGEMGSSRSDLSLSFSEPWLMDKPVSLAFDLYDVNREQSRFSRWDYDEERKGGDIGLGWKMFDEYTRTYLTYKYEDVSISNVNEAATTAIKEEAGSFVTSSLTPSIVRSTLDNVFDPGSGSRQSFSVEVAGGAFGGDRDFIRYILDSRWYWPVFKDVTLSLHSRGGVVEEYDDTTAVPIYERFFIGGMNTVRGYQDRDIGPKDASGIPSGGKAMLIANLELTRPLVEQVKGAIFYDVGSVWAKPGDINLGDLRSSVGAGVRVTTPLGPIRFDYGYGLNYEPGDKRGRFHFSMGYVF